MADPCAVCGQTENLNEHHRDGDRSNNDGENLIWLCTRHHRQVHGDSQSEYLKDDLVRELKAELPEHEDIAVQCSNCDYGWTYSGLLDQATCPSCLSKTAVETRPRDNA